MSILIRPHFSEKNPKKLPVQLIFSDFNLPKTDSDIKRLVSIGKYLSYPNFIRGKIKIF